VRQCAVRRAARQWDFADFTGSNLPEIHQEIIKTGKAETEDLLSPVFLKIVRGCRLP